MNKKSLGNLGESYAEKYLAAQGYQVIKRNHFARVGEIDIIAIDRQSNQLVFLEVKTRSSQRFGTPQDALTRQKKSRLFKAALHFINSSNLKLPHSWRLDLIALQLSSKRSIKNITHFKNILDD